jgi:lysozyme family protein
MAGYNQNINATDEAAFGEEPQSSFDFQKLLQREGGDKLHTDSGGLTKYGITTAWGLDEDQITNLTEQEALDLYGDKYNHWASSWQGEGGSQAVGDKMFDVSVNMGRSGANKVMQNTLTNLGYETDVDGGWSDGGQTDTNYKQAISDHGEQAVLQALIKEQNRHYSDIVAGDPEKYGDYAKGWENRASFMSDYAGSN